MQAQNNSMPLSQQQLLLELADQAQKELQKRELQSSLLAFTKYFFEARGEAFLESWHHREISDALARVERGEIQNLLINMPPRYGKTEMAVINWIAQSLARNPRAKFIHLSYSGDLALDNSGKIRELVMSEPFQEYWPLKLKQDSKSKQKWYTAEGGGLYATAAGGALTGFGAGNTADEDTGVFEGAIIIDDPIKPDDARSDVVRTGINERLNSTIKSRRNDPKRTPIVIIMQRVHEDDMSGYVLAEKMGEKFHHLKLKALGDDGKPLWPIKHDVVQLEQMRTFDRMTFASQYQQEPAPAEGAVYKLAWFPRFDRLPDPPTRTMKVLSVDTAFKANQHNDPSCILEWHVTPSLYYLANVYVGRWEYPELKRKLLSVQQEVNADAILIEDKASGQSLIQELRLTSLPIIAIEPDADKETRARTTAAMVEASKVALPNLASWLHEFETEITTFPFSKHDDRVDAMSQFLRWMRDKGTSDMEYQKLMDDWFNA